MAWARDARARAMGMGRGERLGCELESGLGCRRKWERGARRGWSAGGEEARRVHGGFAVSQSRGEESEAKAALLRSRCVFSGAVAPVGSGDWRGYTICHCQRAATTAYSYEKKISSQGKRYGRLFSLLALETFWISFCAKVSLV